MAPHQEPFRTPLASYDGPVSSPGGRQEVAKVGGGEGRRVECLIKQDEGIWIFFFFK